MLVLLTKKVDNVKLRFIYFTTEKKKIKKGNNADKDEARKVKKGTICVGLNGGDQFLLTAVKLTLQRLSVNKIP